MADLNTTADELESIARHLRLAGDVELVREVTRAMRRAVEPVKEEIRAGLKPKLPDRYAAVLDGGVRLGVNVRTSDRDPGVTLTGTPTGKARKLRYLDAGRLTHPVFGDRETWRTQEVEPGWFTGPAQDADPRVRRDIEQALDDISNLAAGRGA